MTEKNKLKILYILEMMKKTDENHPLNSSQIVKKLALDGIKVERKSIGRVLTCLEEAGYSIVKCENHNLGWYMLRQEFENYEVKLLADMVASAKFLSLKDSRKLIKKLKKLATIDGEKIIEKTVHIDSAIKKQDGKFKFYYDAIMRAIAEQRQIRFQYYALGSDNKKILRKDGHMYQVSPYYMLLVDEQYYLIGNMEKYNNPVNFRVELMTNLEIMEEKVRPMEEVELLNKIGSDYTIGDYIRESVHMWSGETTYVKLRCTSECRHDILKKFGEKASIREDGEGYFIARVKVSESLGFYQWLASYGANIVIQSPQSMREQYINYLKKTLECYE